MPTPEDKVKQEVVKVLSGLSTAGDVLWWSRLQCGKVKNEYSGAWLQLCNKGTPDFICVFRDKWDNLMVLFIECKRPDCIPELNDNQKKFLKSIEGKHENLNMIVVRSGKEASGFIIEFMYSRIGDMEL
jgi:hypothetical protein